MFDAPDELMADRKLLEGSMAVRASKDQTPPAPKLGPREFLAVMAGAAGR